MYDGKRKEMKNPLLEVTCKLTSKNLFKHSFKNLKNSRVEM